MPAIMMTRCCVYLRSKLSKLLPDVLAEPARLFLAIFAEARELQDCYCAGIGLCRASSSRMIDRISPTIRNEPVTRIQPRPRANADAHITASRGCESSSAARSSSSAKRRSSPGAHDEGPEVDLVQMTTSTRCRLRRSSISNACLSRVVPNTTTQNLPIPEFCLDRATPP